MTAVLHFANPAPCVMKALSGRHLPMLCRSVFEGADLLQDPSTNKRIGTGPFKFVSWECGQSVRLDRDEAYRKPSRPATGPLDRKIKALGLYRDADLEPGRAMEADSPRHGREDNPRAG